METKICGVVLPKDVAHEARIVAAKEGKSRSEFMRELIIDFLNKYSDQKPEEVVKARSLIDD